MGEIRIRFLIIFTVKAALDPVGEGEGLLSRANWHFPGSSFPGQGESQVGVPKVGRKGPACLSLRYCKDQGIWTLVSQE